MRYRPIRFQAVGSTNDIVLEAARAGAEPGLVVQAAIQRRGRGRKARDWASPEGGLWMSVLLEADLPQASRGLVPLAVGYACCRAIQDLGATVGIRWPNDLMLGDAKLGGILVESRTEGLEVTQLVAGIGINVTNPPPTDQAARLGDEIPSLTPKRLRDAILKRLDPVEEALAEGRAKTICNWFMQHAWGIGRELRLDGEPRIPKEIAVDGALIVETPDGGIEVHRSGSLRSPAGPADR